MGWKAKLARAGAIGVQMAAIGPLALLTSPIVDIGLQHAEKHYDKK